MKYYFVNTNKKSNSNGYDEKTMLNEEIVAAYSKNGKRGLEKLKIGDVVFLYSINKGIIASGIVCSDFFKRNFHGLKKLDKIEYYRKLKNFKVIEKPLSAVVRSCVDMTLSVATFS